MCPFPNINPIVRYLQRLHGESTDLREYSNRELDIPEQTPSAHELEIVLKSVSIQMIELVKLNPNERDSQLDAVSGDQFESPNSTSERSIVFTGVHFYILC